MLEDAGYQYTTESPDVRVATPSSLAVTEGWVQEGTPLAYDMLVREEFPEEKDIAGYLHDQWLEVGVLIDYRVITEAQLSTIVYTYNYDTMIWYWSADPDPNYMLFVQTKAAWKGWSDNCYYNQIYEDNYSLSVSEFNYDLRKQEVDSCQRVNYLDAAYILLAYAYQTYAWRDDTFEGWGDWDANPGRSADAFWTGNPLYFDLVPLTPAPDGGFPLIYVAIGAGIAIAAVAAVVYLMKAKKKRSGGEGESPLGD
jgi:peptide/nickel transport system substrate-binding protein